MMLVEQSGYWSISAHYPGRRQCSSTVRRGCAETCSNCRYDRGMNLPLRSFASALLVTAAGLLAGCQSSPVSHPAISPPALQLTSAAPLQLAADCQSSGSVIVDFKVLADGSTSAIRTPAVPDCLHDALTAWVSSFRYSPPGVTVPGSVEWLLVSAKKKSS